MKQPKPAEAKQPDKPQLEPSISITKDEIKAIREIARGLNILNEVASEDGEIVITSFWWLIDKICEPAWTLGFDTLKDRWDKEHPDDKFQAFD